MPNLTRRSDRSEMQRPSCSSVRRALPSSFAGLREPRSFPERKHRSLRFACCWCCLSPSLESSVLAAGIHTSSFQSQRVQVPIFEVSGSKPFGVRLLGPQHEMWHGVLGRSGSSLLSLAEAVQCRHASGGGCYHRAPGLQFTLSSRLRLFLHSQRVQAPKRGVLGANHTINMLD